MQSRRPEAILSVIDGDPDFRMDPRTITYGKTFAAAWDFWIRYWQCGPCSLPGRRNPSCQGGHSGPDRRKGRGGFER